MAIYTTFFLCKPNELAGGFPDWAPDAPDLSLDETAGVPEAAAGSIEDQALEWLTEAPAPAAQKRHVASGEGSYQDYLEGRLPGFVRDRPHWAAKGLTEVELEPLAQALGLDAELADAFPEPSASGAIMLRLPPAMPAKLTALDQRGLEALAAKWATAMSTPENTHSAAGDKLSDGWSAAQAMGILVPLQALARKATPQDDMYLLIEV